MAEKDTGQEKTEEATPKRIADARSKGDVPRSKELNTVLMLLASLVGIALLAGPGASAYKNMAFSLWQIERENIFSTQAMLNAFHSSIVESMWIMAPFLLLMFLTVFIGPLFMGGWVFSVKSLKVDFKKVNPLSGLKRLFGIQGLVELLKALMKVVLLGGVAVWLFGAHIDDFLRLGVLPIEEALKEMFKLMFIIALTLVVTLGLVALVDVPFQKWNYAKKLRMTFQEVKEENKEQQGNPEVKSKIRQMQQANTNRQMIQDVPTADVIIVNPTHYSVALKYDENSVAPLVVAKGVDHMALYIRQVAVESDVAIFSAPLLARALHRHSEVGETIPSELYLAVAQVLAYVLQVKEANFFEKRRLLPPTDIPVPPEFQDPTDE